MTGKKLTPKQKEHNKYLASQFTFNLWECFSKIMSKDHVTQLYKCDTIKEKEEYLFGVESLFKQYVANYKIPKHIVNKSDAYITLRSLTRYNFHKQKYNKSIKLCISQLKTCALRKTTSKRRFTKNKLIIKSDWTCINTASNDNGTHYDSEWDWVQNQYYKNIEGGKNDKDNNRWSLIDTWTLKQDT
tara:strand:+ start:26 stop:586 length:561 start_codon:yes stop_codon:yes gene_type:complete